MFPALIFSFVSSWAPAPILCYILALYEGKGPLSKQLRLLLKQGIEKLRWKMVGPGGIRGIQWDTPLLVACVFSGAEDITSESQEDLLTHAVSCKLYSSLFLSYCILSQYYS